MGLMDIMMPEKSSAAASLHTAWVTLLAMTAAVWSAGVRPSWRMGRRMPARRSSRASSMLEMARYSAPSSSRVRAASMAPWP